MKAKLITSVSAECPNCEKGRFGISHVTGSYGPWGCRVCGRQYKFNITNDDGVYEVDMIEMDDYDTPAWLVVEIGEHHPPIYAIVDHVIYSHHNNESKEELYSANRYWVEEHTCPTNIVRVNELVVSDNCDPHGILSFIGIIPKEDYRDDLDNDAKLDIIRKAKQEHELYLSPLDSRHTTLKVKSFEEIWEQSGPWEGGREIIKQMILDTVDKPLSLSKIEFEDDKSCANFIFDALSPDKLAKLPDEKSAIATDRFISVLESYGTLLDKIVLMYKNVDSDEKRLEFTNLSLVGLEEEEVSKGGLPFWKRFSIAFGIDPNEVYSGLTLKIGNYTLQRVTFNSMFPESSVLIEDHSEDRYLLKYSQERLEPFPTQSIVVDSNPIQE